MPVRGNYEDLKALYDGIEKGKKHKKIIEDGFFSSSLTFFSRFYEPLTHDTMILL